MKSGIRENRTCRLYERTEEGYAPTSSDSTAMKQGNSCGAKGLAGEPLEWGHFLQTQSWIKEVNKTSSNDSFVKGWEGFPEEPDAGKLQVRFCERIYSGL